MRELTRAVPVRKWYVRVESIVDEGAALEAWRQLVRAQGWSPVGEPEIVPPTHGNSGVIGRVVEYPGITVSPDIRDAVLVPR